MVYLDKLISLKYVQHDIKAIKLLGQDCLSSAVFLTLKKYLERREVDVSNIKPSTALLPYFEKYFSAMVEQTTIIAGGRKVFTQLDIKRKKTGFINYINIFDKKQIQILDWRNSNLQRLDAKGN